MADGHPGGDEASAKEAGGPRPIAEEEPPARRPRLAGGFALEGLEEEWVEVDPELRLLWHRPSISEVDRQWQDPRTIRVFVSGCFDLMHAGHFNALRQAKSLFYQRGFERVVVVAGVHSDEAIAGQKGPPLMTEEERCAVVRATKWVDELATGLPYVSMSAQLADALRVRWICHGDDLPVTRSGQGLFADAIARGRFQRLKRTEGISTTGILARLLELQGGPPVPSEPSSLRHVLATTQRLAQFAAPADPWQPAGKLSEARRVVYVSGAFDLLHAGHAQLLAEAARLGDYLLVGLHSDETLLRETGSLPALTLFERAMAVLSLRPVDDVVLDAPWAVSQELLTTFNITTVAVGRRHRDHTNCAPPDGCEPSCDQLALPRALGLLVEVQTSSPLTEDGLRRRVAERSGELAARNGALLQKELTYLEGRGYVPEA